jgi:hypothetical protein
MTCLEIQVVNSIAANEYHSSTFSIQVGSNDATAKTYDGSIFIMMLFCNNVF